MSESTNNHQENAVVPDIDLARRAEELHKKMDSLNGDNKYEQGAKALLTANTALFITLVWKTIDVHARLPVTAKISIIFFALGAALAILRSVINYLSCAVENKPIMDDAAQFFHENKEFIKTKMPDKYEAWAVQAAIFKWLDSISLKYFDSAHPSLTLIQLTCMFSEYAALALSGVAFILGVLFLLIEALSS